MPQAQYRAWPGFVAIGLVTALVTGYYGNQAWQLSKDMKRITPRTTPAVEVTNNREFLALAVAPAPKGLEARWDWYIGTEQITNWPIYVNKHKLIFVVEYKTDMRNSWTVLGYSTSNSFPIPTMLSRAYFRVGNTNR